MLCSLCSAFVFFFKKSLLVSPYRIKTYGLEKNPGENGRVYAGPFDLRTEELSELKVAMVTERISKQR